MQLFANFVKRQNRCTFCIMEFSKEPWKKNIFPDFREHLGIKQNCKSALMLSAIFISHFIILSERLKEKDKLYGRFGQENFHNNSEQIWSCHFQNDFCISCINFMGSWHWWESQTSEEYEQQRWQNTQGNFCMRFFQFKGYLLNYACVHLHTNAFTLITFELADFIFLKANIFYCFFLLFSCKL